MRVQIVNRYVQSALDVIAKETGQPVQTRRPAPRG